LRPDLDEYYLIDQYLDNKLQGEELHAFEKRMSIDNSFANQVQEQKMLNNFILEAELKSVRLQIEKDLLKLNSPSFFRTYWKWIGLSTLGILGLFFYTFNNTGTKKSVVTAEQKSDLTEQSNDLTAVSEANIATIQNSKAVHKTEITSTETLIGPATQKNDTLHRIETIEAPAQQKNNIVNTVETMSIDTKQTTEIKKIDCSTVKISFSLKSQATCKDEEEGSISIENINGGTAPYTFLLGSKKIKERKISELGEGIYAITITDKNGCSSEQKTTVFEKNCALPVHQQTTKFNINPTIGEVCKIPFNPNKTGNLSVYNRSGKTVFKVMNNTDESVEWAGTDGYGSLVEQGLYVYIIEYTDGTKESGEVNIVR